MTVETDIAVLSGQIEKGLLVLDKINAFHDRFTTQDMSPQRPAKDAIVLAEVLTNYYTCVETIYLRISQFFENSLSPDRWHRDLLEKMTLSIAGVREQALSDEVFPMLLELQKFRHFRRYYFEIEYDWDRLGFLLKKYREARPLVVRDLRSFLAFLSRLAEQPSV